MTDTTIIVAEHSADDEGQQPTQGTLEHLDPHQLALETNVRDEAALVADFVDSVREHGVINPIVAVRGDDGVVRVRAGQRRTLAAREVGLSTVPVYVRPATTGDDKAKVAERVAEQIVENDQRQALTDAQRATGIQQMLDAGVSATKVAKKLSVPRETVKAAATAAGSAAAMEALSSGQLSLSEAAVLTEFDDDPEAICELLSVAGTGRFEHKVAQIRQQRETDKAYDEAVARYVEQGYTVLDEYPTYGDSACVELRYLRTDTDEVVTEEVITDPAHWAVYLTEESAYVDRESGEPVDSDDIDWYCRHTGSEPEDGKRHPNSVTEQAVFEPEWFCTNYAAAGLALCHTLAKRAEAIARDAANGGDRDQDDDARAVAKAEAERRERKKVLALNKLGDAAQQVRRTFITEKILARKTPPKGAAIFVVHCLTRDPRLVDEYHGHAVVAEMLGVTGIEAVHKHVSELGAAGDGRAQVITLALVLGALEARTPKDAWRGSPGWGHHVGAADLLKFLADNGYPLSDVEGVMVGERTADEVYTANSQQSAGTDD